MIIVAVTTVMAGGGTDWMVGEGVLVGADTITHVLELGLNCFKPCYLTLQPFDFSIRIVSVLTYYISLNSLLFVRTGKCVQFKGCRVKPERNRLVHLF